MTGRIPARPAKLFAAILASTALMAIAASGASAAPEVIYNSIPSPFPGNVPSLGFEATSAAEFGGQVEFAGTPRRGATVTVAMSSWACQSGGAEDGSCVSAMGSKFEWPVTLKVYEVGPANTVGSLVYTSTSTFKMPYRPSANSKKCGTGASTGGWYSGVDKECHHGKLFRITFRLGGAMLPATKAIVSVAYNTTDHGYSPTGVAGPYDSLNVGLTGAATVGAQPQPNDAYYNTTYGPFYCDEGLGGTGTFRYDAGCWTGYQPEFQVKAG
jgi:hypothetical protein